MELLKQVDENSILKEWNSDDPEVERARYLQSAGQLDEAEAIYLDALNRNYEDPFVLFLLGSLYLQKNRYGLSVTVLFRACQLCTTVPEFFNNLGTACKAMGRYHEAEMAFLKALGMREAPDFLNNMATVNINNGTPKVAEEYCRRTLLHQPDHAQAEWNLALSLLEQGRWSEGWRHYDAGFRTSGRWHRQYNCGDWDGTFTDTLVVYGEQGIGDEIMFATMILDILKQGLCRHLVVDCHPRLGRLFARSFQPTATTSKISIHTDRKGACPPPWVYAHNPTAKVAMGSLGRFFRNSAAHFPDYGAWLKPSPEKMERIRPILAEMDPTAKRWVGIGWAGGTQKTNQDQRSLIPPDLLPILKAAEPGTAFLSLQYTPGAAEWCVAMEREFGVKIHHVQEWVDNYDYTAAVVGCLDLLISVCTAAIHLAGCVGTEAWCLTPHRVAWRYQLEGDRMIWYPQFVRLYRQTGPDSGWNPVFTQVVEDFKAWQHARITEPMSCGA